MKRVLIPLADGCEEIETVTIADTLRRAGIEVVLAGLKPGPVTASRGVRLIPDAEWPALAWDHFDAIVLPGGGPGTQALMADERVLDAVRQFHAAGKWVAALCAAPQVLQKAGILTGKRATCYPGVGPALASAILVDESVVEDAQVITSRGPGTSFAFALTLVRVLAGAERAEKVARELLVPVP